jgi:hypothetical protein
VKFVPILKGKMMVRPHPDPLPQEREQQSSTRETSSRARFADRLTIILPLPSGEGRGEGKTKVLLQIAQVWRLMFTFICLLATMNLRAATTNDLSDAEIQGRQLAQQLLEQRPNKDFTNSGVLQIRGVNGKRSEIPIRFQIIVTELNSLNWLSVYQAIMTNKEVKLMVMHPPDTGANGYRLFGDGFQKNLAGNETMTSFAGSDFWIADLGLEFFHWPEQKILKHEMRRGQPCKVLESTNPTPSTNGYSRVVSWIDNESGGIVHAEAYDVNGKLLKEFDPKSFKKVNGQWELQDMEIRNVQTGSRTRLEFDLKAH